MLRSDLCDFDDAYIVVEGKVTASFNPRKDDCGANDFTDNLFPNRIFPSGSTAELLQEMLLKLLLLMSQTMLLMIQETLLKVFLLKMMLHLSTAFQKLMDH